MLCPNLKSHEVVDLPENIKAEPVPTPQMTLINHIPLKNSGSGLVSLPAYSLS